MKIYDYLKQITYNVVYIMSVYYDILLFTFYLFSGLIL